MTNSEWIGTPSLGTASTSNGCRAWLDAPPEPYAGPTARFASFPVRQEMIMAVCDTCGNDYDKTFTVTLGEHQGTFDSFECAAHALAPVCAHCGCRILGHGVEVSGIIYCCAHCAQRAGAKGITDRA